MEKESLIKKAVDPVEDAVVCEVKCTSDMTEAYLERYVALMRVVYNSGENVVTEFEKKYVKNIYGPSIHVFAFVGNICVGIQSFLRNDISGELAYQSGDSAVHPDYRGKGIFKKMVRAGMERLGKDTLVYGFPNNNSLPAFVQMGWKIDKRNKYQLFTRGHSEELPHIDGQYLKWMLVGNESLFIWTFGGEAYLVKKRRFNLYLLIGRISLGSDSTDLNLERRKVSHIIPLFYSENGTLGNGMVRIYSPTYRGKAAIPVYKIDTLLV